MKKLKATKTLISFSENSLEETIKEKDEPPDDGGDINKILNAEPQKEVGSFFDTENKKISQISYQINQNHFGIKVFDNFRYSVKYPRFVFDNLDLKTKEVLLDNFTYCKTIPLNLISNLNLVYQSRKPLLKDFIDYGLRKDVARISDITKIKSSQFLKRLKESKIIFPNQTPDLKLLPLQNCSEKKAILSLSFGKDSLLTYGLLKELGWDVQLVFVNDMEGYNPNELKLKREIIKDFSKEQKEKVIILEDNTDNLFRNPKIQNNIDELDGTNAMLSFALELIPVAYKYLAKYIIFGNEKNLDDFFVNGERLKTYPSYDQSSFYTKKVNRYLGDLTNNNIEIVSLIKPLYNIAEIKILYHRYPHLLKYIMSCSSPLLRFKEAAASSLAEPCDSEARREKRIKFSSTASAQAWVNEKWCGSCHTCVWGFLYGAAMGNPEKVGLKENFFKKKYLNLYRLFNPKIEKIYEKPPAVRDEQLLAFYLAYKNGYKGEIINLFKKLYLKEAQKREGQLRKKFFNIHSTNSLPKELKNKVLNIYREELQDLK